MQKITEIKEQHKVNRREKVNGETVFVEKTFVKYRPVKFVDGFPRFGHYLLDRVFLYIFSIAIGVLLGLLFLAIGRTDLFDHPYFDIFDFLFSWLIVQPLYYFIFEVSIQSTPAKAILGRIVVDEYGNKPTPRQILIRSFTRAVPFEAFSCLSQTGWHDDWSGTFVIRKKELKELQLLQKINELQDQPLSEEKNDRDR